MPSVNSGPSNSATVNTQTPVIASQASSILAGGPLVTQSGVSVANPLTSMLIAQSAVMVGIAPTGTMGANGAVTLGTALSVGTNYGGGVYLYFPAGAVYSGSVAGFYLTKMTSTTAGTVFNNIYVAGTSPQTVPAALVPVVDAGPGAYTGVTTIQTAAQFTIPGNVLGPNGCLQLEYLFSWNNSAGNKTPGATWGGNNVLGGAATTTATSYGIRSIYNRGVTNLQVQPATGTSLAMGNVAAAFNTNTVDTTQPSTFALTLTLAAATDYITLEFYRVTAVYGP